MHEIPQIPPSISENAPYFHWYILLPKTKIKLNIKIYDTKQIYYGNMKNKHIYYFHFSVYLLISRIHNLAL